MAEPRRRKNPIFPRMHDPFFGTTRDFLIGLGQGDYQKGYDQILDNAIEAWNETAEARGLPKTSREHGMEWIPVWDGDKFVKAPERGDDEAENDKSPDYWWDRYTETFDTHPNVTIIRMNEHNGSIFIEGVKKAIKRGTPLTEEEEHHIERTTFKDFYDRREAGRRITF